MNIRSAAEYITPLLNAADNAVRSSVCVKFSKSALESCYRNIDTLEHTSKKIGAVCLAIFAVLCTTVGALLVGIEAAGRTIKEIGAAARLHQTPIKIAACINALLIAPGIAVAYATFSYATILDETIKRFKGPAPLQKAMQEAAVQ